MNHRDITARVAVLHRGWARPGTSFTQGLAIAQGSLWESVGLYGASGLRQLGLPDLRPRWSATLPDRLFGEGICRSTAGLWQLTWREGAAVCWDPVHRCVREEVAYDREGWGACTTPRGVLTSDGTSELVVRDPDTLRPLQALEVRAAGRPVFGLNDLEWALGRIWANVHGRDCVVGIDPDTGSVTDLVDARGLRQHAGTGLDVLNGLAHDPRSGFFYVTGKRWPRMFAVQFAVVDHHPGVDLDLPTTPVLNH
jgi:glutaminyl-peptide cyclotransferase